MIMMEALPLESLYSEELYKIRKKVIIIISRPWKEIADEQKLLLEKILGAVKLNLAAVQIIQSKEFNIEDFKAYGPPSCIISFGATVKGPFKKYEQFYVQETSILIADELIELDDEKKRHLWMALKQLFQS